MLIVCPSCVTSYDVEPANLEPDGRYVRCVRCRTVWRAELPHVAKAIAAIEALAGGRADPEVSIAAAAEQDAAAASAPAVAAAESSRIDPSPEAQVDGQSADVPAEPAAHGEHSEPAAIADPADEPGEAVEVEAPPIAPAQPDSWHPPIDVKAEPVDASSHVADVETLAAQRSRRDVKRRRLWSLSRLQTSILILLIVDSILVGWRADVVRAVPQTASLYAAMGLAVNLRGLSFDGVTTSTETHEGVPVLAVQGNIVNDGGSTIGVPRLKFVVRNAARQEIYSWSTAPPLPRLSPHQAVGFRTRLASPPPDSSDVLVRFLNRRDAVADMR